MTPSQMLAEYAHQRGLDTPTERGDMTVVKLDSLEASFRGVGSRDGYLLICVSSEQRLASAITPDALITCNLWNARVRLPRARLTTDGPVSQVILDGCVPYAAVRSQVVFDALTDAILTGAERFWRCVDMHASW